MTITSKSKKRNRDIIEITLSNGDDVWIYDDNDGFATIGVNRHAGLLDETEPRSQLTSSTNRAYNLKETQVTVKEKKIELEDEWNWRRGNKRRTQVEVTHFYPTK